MTQQLSGSSQALAVMKGDLYIGGEFWFDQSIASHLVKWNGAAISQIGVGMLKSYVSALAVVGDDLYVGGGIWTWAEDFFGGSCIAKVRLNGAGGEEWSIPGGEGRGIKKGAIRAFALIDNNLYVGGSFANANDVSGTSGIARWDGSSWSALGGGVKDAGVYPSTAVASFTVSGDNLYVGGYFQGVTNAVNGSSDGEIYANNFAKWNTASSLWSELDNKTVGEVGALAVFGNYIYVGGWWISDLGDRISRYGLNSSGEVISYSIPGAGIKNGGNVSAFAVSGNDLYVAGHFVSAGGVNGANCIAKWDGSMWSALKGNTTNINENAYISSLLVTTSIRSLTWIATEH